MTDVLFFNADDILADYLHKTKQKKITPVLFKESLNHIDKKELDLDKAFEKYITNFFIYDYSFSSLHSFQCFMLNQ